MRECRDRKILPDEARVVKGYYENRAEVYATYCALKFLDGTGLLQVLTLRHLVAAPSAFPPLPRAVILRRASTFIVSGSISRRRDRNATYHAAHGEELACR